MTREELYEMAAEAQGVPIEEVDTDRVDQIVMEVIAGDLGGTLAEVEDGRHLLTTERGVFCLCMDESDVAEAIRAGTP